MIAPRATEPAAAGSPPRSRALSSASHRRTRPSSPNDASDVEERHHGNEAEEDQEPDGVDGGLELRRETLPEDPGHEDEEQSAAVETRERHDVDDREVHREDPD